MKHATLACVALIVAGLLASARAMPSVSAIERAFNLHPGMTIPLVMPSGEQIRIVYERIEPRRSGEYAVVVKLQP